MDPGSAQAALDPIFYSKACPNVVQIVATVVNKHVKQDNTMGAPIVRMFFHDCFVRVSICVIVELQAALIESICSLL
jgi:peroxidase